MTSFTPRAKNPETEDFLEVKCFNRQVEADLEDIQTAFTNSTLDNLVLNSDLGFILDANLNFIYYG